MKDNKGSLRNVRVLKKNMIFLQSYDQHIPTSVLKQVSTFTPCGQIDSVKTKQNFKNITTYVSYGDEQAAATALLAFSHLSSRLRVLFGTVQYCKYFMRKAECRNQGCVFLHVREKKNQITVNDQIQQSVYDDHYDMALDLLEPEDFKNLRNVLQNDSIEESSLIKRGLRKAVEDLNIQLTVPGEGGTAKESEVSTEESELGRDQIFQKTQVKEEEMCLNQNKQREYTQDLLTLRLVKRLVRQNNSRRHQVGEDAKEQVHRRGKMMLYQIVRQ